MPEMHFDVYREVSDGGGSNVIKSLRLIWKRLDCKILFVSPSI